MGNLSKHPDRVSARLIYVFVCSTLRQRADPVYSPPLQISGLCWRLKVYPVSLKRLMYAF